MPGENTRGTYRVRMMKSSFKETCTAHVCTFPPPFHFHHARVGVVPGKITLPLRKSCPDFSTFSFARGLVWIPQSKFSSLSPSNAVCDITRLGSMRRSAGPRIINKSCTH